MVQMEQQFTCRKQKPRRSGVVLGTADYRPLRAAGTDHFDLDAAGSGAALPRLVVGDRLLLTLGLGGDAVGRGARRGVGGPSRVRWAPRELLVLRGFFGGAGGGERHHRERQHHFFHHCYLPFCQKAGSDQGPAREPSAFCHTSKRVSKREKALLRNFPSANCNSPATQTCVTCSRPAAYTRCDTASKHGASSGPRSATAARSAALPARSEPMRSPKPSACAPPRVAARSTACAGITWASPATALASSAAVRISWNMSRRLFLAAPPGPSAMF